MAGGRADAAAAQLVDDCFGPQPVTGGVGVETILGVQPLPVVAKGRACLSGDVDVDGAGGRPRHSENARRGCTRLGTAPPMSGTPSNTVAVPAGSPRTRSR